MESEVHIEKDDSEGRLTSDSRMKAKIGTGNALTH